MLKEQREKDGRVLISTITFNTVSTVVHDRADIDTVETAAKYGIEREMAVEYLSDKIGTAKNFRAMSMARAGGAVAPCRKNDIEEDRKSRM